MKFAKGTNMRPEVTMKVLSTWTYEPATCIGDSFCFVAIVIGNQVGTMYWDGKVWTVMPFNVTRFPEELRPENKNKSFLIGTFGVDCISAWACFLVGAVEQWAENATTYEAVGDYIWLYEPRTKRSEQMLHYSLAPRTETRRFFNGIKCVPERSVCHVSMWSSQLPSSMWAITPIRT